MHIQHLPVLLQVGNIDFTQFGLAGVVIGALIWYISIKDKTHKEERAEWRRDMLNQYAKYDKTTQTVVQDFKEALKQNNEAFKQNSYDLRQDRDKFNESINKNSELLGAIKAKL